ncbi:uroporphyrinogen-III synthase [Pseudomonas fontis]|uniref:Uroporphyrinogen-III synthase n=1 Tax=Pseudomonas fontis TaxID=2942633 RepID=A0ABT5NRJ1_9PSED|nr:uroporphyrinogen-III synthase [Pseudomonas fontis]MDD0976681.1 uroporphyrinogen-III synthase [Pseudomonas fontis]MDD0990793.1 uroporphyrinogen-III synthase [Pseudomonas fontis]
MTGWRLLLTRPAEECAALADTLAAAGLFGSSLPLLDIEPLPVTDAQQAIVRDLNRYCAVIVVSKPAARLGLELIERCGISALTPAWFTVGAASAAVLQAQGLSVHFPAQGDDSEALLQLPQLQAAIAGAAPRVLIMRGAEGRELLAEQLTALGASVDYLPLYRRQLPVYPPATLSRRIAAERLNGLVVSSGQGFQHLRELAGDDWPRLARWPLFVPSPRVAELARAAGAQHVVDCRGANAAALLAALQETPAPAL